MAFLSDKSSIKRDRRVPPLNALRAFEAAARCGSFKLASEELNVTPGAISRQIMYLEEHLSVKLFQRQHKRVVLTLAGQYYLSEVGPAFDRIAIATAKVTDGADDRVLKLKMPPTFAIRWFIPRLASLHALDEKISVQITTSHDTVDFDREDVDAAIRWGAEPADRSILSYRLFGEVLMAVCSPRFPRPPEGFTPEAIGREVLLHSIQRPHDWPRWFEVCGATSASINRTLIFQNSSLTYQGAIEGLGVAIGQAAFLWDELKTGRLIEAHPARAVTDTAYFLTFPKERATLPRIKLLRSWLLDEADRTERSLKLEA